MIETLMALLIATLVLMFLATSIVAAGRLNAVAKKNNHGFQYDNGLQPGNVDLTVTGEKGYNETITVDGYKTEDGFLYYQPKQEGSN